jgi:hypothetical protein
LGGQVLHAGNHALGHGYAMKTTVQPQGGQVQHHKGKDGIAGDLMGRLKLAAYAACQPSQGAKGPLPCAIASSNRPLIASTSSNPYSSR